jgi:hypothetical protein
VSLLSPFLNIGITIAFLHSFGIQFSAYILFKNFNNLSLNSSGVYLYNSEIMLSSPGLLPFFVNSNAFSNSSNVTEVSK